MSFYDIPWSNFNALFCLGYVFIFLFFNENNFMTRFYGMKGVAFFGNISYPAYLLHQGIRELFTKNFGWKKSHYTLSFCLLLTIIVAYLLHITVETYFVNLTKFWFYEKVEVKVPVEERKLMDFEEIKEEKINDNNVNSYSDISFIYAKHSIVAVGCAIYTLGYFFGTLTGAADPTLLNVIYYLPSS